MQQVRVNGYLEDGAICRKCHTIEGDIICDYCFCPLYHTDCGGDFIIMPAGIKDCSGCIIPHNREFVEARKGGLT